MRPINKTAAMVTAQGDTSDSFLIEDKKSLKILGERKKYFMDAMVALKAEIGIDAREGSGARTKYPPKILRHPKFKQLKTLRESLTKLDVEIREVKARINKAQPDESLESRFMKFVKVNHPEIHRMTLDALRGQS